MADETYPRFEREAMLGDLAARRGERELPRQPVTLEPMDSSDVVEAPGFGAVLPCIACGCTLTEALPGESNQPHCGTAFTTHGHYGSGVFDPMTDVSLMINVCDGCLTAAGAAGRVYAVTHVPVREYRPEMTLWRGEPS